MANPKQKKPKLHYRHQAVINRYFSNGFDKTEALAFCDYSSPNSNINSVFARPEVQAEIQRRLDAQRYKSDLDATWIIERLMRIADSGAILARFKRVDDEGLLYWDFEDASPEELSLINELHTEVMGLGGQARTPSKGRPAKRPSVMRKMKITSSDPLAALDRLARIEGLYNDKLELTGEMSLVDRIQAGRNRAAAKKKEDS